MHRMFWKGKTMTTQTDLQALKPEEWRPVVGYEGYYEVSDYGNVRSLSRSIRCKDGRLYSKKGKNLRPSTTPDGYPIVQLCKNGVGKFLSVHRLVMKAFRGHSDLNVNHKNGITNDNNIENLEYVSGRMNTIHGINNGNRYTGVRKHCKRWQSCIRVKGKLLYLGSFKTAEEASLAYQKKLSEIEEIKYGNHAAMRGTI